MVVSRPPHCRVAVCNIFSWGYLGLRLDIALFGARQQDDGSPLVDRSLGDLFSGVLMPGGLVFYFLITISNDIVRSGFVTPLCDRPGREWTTRGMSPHRKLLRTRGMLKWGGFLALPFPTQPLLAHLVLCLASPVTVVVHVTLAFAASSDPSDSLFHLGTPGLSSFLLDGENPPHRETSVSRQLMASAFPCSSGHSSRSIVLFSVTELELDFPASEMKKKKSILFFQLHLKVNAGQK